MITPLSGPLPLADAEIDSKHQISLKLDFMLKWVVLNGRKSHRPYVKSRSSWKHHPFTTAHLIFTTILSANIFANNFLIDDSYEFNFSIFQFFTNCTSRR